MTRPPPPPPALAPLAGPLALELLLGIGVGVVGTMLAARISDPAAAALALGQHVNAMLFILFRIVAMGASVAVTQSLGAGQRDAAAAIARASLGASTWMGLGCAAVAALGAGALLSLLNAPPEVLPLATPFLVALAPALLLDAWSASASAVLRAHLQARAVLRVIVVTHSLHLLFAAALMQGWGPLPALGLPGFAVGLLLARAVGLALYAQLWRRALGLVLRPDDLWRWRPGPMAAVLHVGLPGAAENIAYRLAFMVSVAVVSAQGTTALATHAYTSQINYFGLVFGLAAGFAAEILVGHLVGAGRLGEADRLVRRTLARALAFSVGVTVLLALAGPWLLRQFTPDAGIVALGATLLWWTVVLEPGRTFNLVVINALRAAGDVRYPVMAGAASMLLVLAGGSWLLGQVMGLGLVGVWLAYAADEWVRGLLMWRRWTQRRWLPHARAVRRRLRAAA
jgi:putative MATE family efflux protein